MKYKLGVVWHMHGTLEVEADSIQEAIDKGNEIAGYNLDGNPIEDSEHVESVYEVRGDDYVLVAEGVTYEGTVWFPVSPVED